MSTFTPSQPARASSPKSVFKKLADIPTTAANARLIAAAPDLLACLKRYVAWQQGDFDAIDIELEILEPAKVAIAAATR